MENDDKIKSLNKLIGESNNQINDNELIGEPNNQINDNELIGEPNNQINDNELIGEPNNQINDNELIGEPNNQINDNELIGESMSNLLNDIFNNEHISMSGDIITLKPFDTFEFPNVSELSDVSRLPAQNNNADFVDISDFFGSENFFEFQETNNQLFDDWKPPIPPKPSFLLQHPLPRLPHQSNIRTKYPSPPPPPSPPSPPSPSGPSGPSSLPFPPFHQLPSFATQESLSIVTTDLLRLGDPKYHAVKDLRELIIKRNNNVDPLMLSESINYNCSLCDSILHSEASLNIHFINVHHGYLNNTNNDSYLCRCSKCDKSFSSDFAYNDHDCENIDNNNTLFDNMPTNPNGKFECPICNKKYSNDNILGEHFIITHNDFSDLGTLDNNIIKKGFPGYDILEELYMIRQIDQKLIIKNNEVCSICCHRFKEDGYIYDDDSDDSDDSDYQQINKKTRKCNSEADLIIHNHNNINNNENKDNKSDSELLNSLSDDEIENIIIDKTLINKLNEIIDRETLPLLMVCCNLLICHDCLRSTLEASNNLICPFCRFDHCKTNLDFFYIVEFDFCDPNLWIPWWKKRLELFI
jgi:hypothetical protein